MKKQQIVILIHVMHMMVIRYMMVINVENQLLKLKNVQVVIKILDLVVQKPRQLIVVISMDQITN